MVLRGYGICGIMERMANLWLRMERSAEGIPASIEAAAEVGWGGG